MMRSDLTNENSIVTVISLAHTYSTDSSSLHQLATIMIHVSDHQNAV